MSEKSEDNGLLARRDELIRRCTEHCFSDEFGEQIGHALQPMISNESQIAIRRPELYVLPRGASIEIPTGFNSRVDSEIQVAWQKYYQRMLDPDRFVVITADSKLFSNTWLKFDTSVPLLKAECATLYCLMVDSIHLPLRISVNRGRAMMLPKQELLSDEDFVELTSSLVRVFGGEKDQRSDDELKADMRRRHVLSKGKEILPLQLLASSPEQFFQLIDSEQLSVNPDRLMTNEEASDWLNMVMEIKELNSIGHDVVVGEKGYGSYCSFQGEIDLTAGIALNRKDLNSDNIESSIQRKSFLAVVRDGDREIGAVVCDMSYYLPLDSFDVRFTHGENDLFYYRQWKSKAGFGE